MMNTGTTRPYPPTGMNTAAWMRLPLERVEYADLTTTQAGVYIEPLLYARLRPGSDPYPQVVEYQGTLYLEDGHTRVTRAILTGRTSGMVRIYHHA